MSSAIPAHEHFRLAKIPRSDFWPVRARLAKTPGREFWPAAWPATFHNIMIIVVVEIFYTAGQARSVSIKRA
jgi:hypothetical protein